ncbi:DUF5348 domain-containing protein [Paenibacillus shunpengii]|uniref:DUF5348 domain-containing protein n=1 Tax=Paenibacillus shunpengii TaxID=2054424 RepID=A0ABW5SYY5_9BACL
MATIEQKEILKEANKLKSSIGTFIKRVVKAEENWTEVYDSKQPEEMYTRNMIELAAYKLQDTYDLFDYLFRPVKIEGNLQRSSSGRYTIPGLGYDLTSGMVIEFLDNEQWVRARIEHKMDYYIYGYPDIPLQGLQIRIK